MRRRTISGWWTASRALAIGLAALGLRPPAVPAGEFTNLPLVANRASPASKGNAKTIGREAAFMSGGPHDRQTTKNLRVRPVFAYTIRGGSVPHVSIASVSEGN